MNIHSHLYPPILLESIGNLLEETMSSSNELQTPLTGGGRTSGSSFLKACFNGINAFLGVGLLTVPYALSSGGWLSLLLFILIAVISFYTGILLKRCMDINPSIKTYIDIAEIAYGKKGKIMVSIIINSEMYLFAIGLLILEGDNLHKLFPNFSVTLGEITVPGKQSFIILTSLVILPSVLLIDLSILSYVSATGVISCLVIFISIFCVGMFDGVGFNASGTLVNVSGFPTAVSLYIICFAGHPVVPDIYTSMRNSFHFTKMLLFSFVVTSATYMSTAVVAYLMYGNEVESQITLNLPTNQVFGEIAIYTTLLIPVTRYALMLKPVADAIEGGLSEDYKNWTLMRLSIRVVLLASTVIVACIFPYYESLMAITGSIFDVLGSFVIPCVCYVKMHRSYERWSYEMICIFGILVFSIAAGILGTYSSIYDLVEN